MYSKHRGSIRKYILLAALLTMISTITGCSPASSVDSNLSDTDRAYSGDYKNMELETEVRGRLSEGNGDMSSQEHVDIVIGEAAYSGVPNNKLLRWGISRRTEHQTPAADPGAPQLLKRYGAAYLGDISEKKIYLTFDEGYENGYTPLILDTLKANSARAVFFITGPYLKGHQDLVQRMVDEGHMVGNHTIHHPSLPELDDSSLEEEVLGLESAFEERFGQSMQFLRPPKGEYSERSLALTQQMGYCNLFWSFAYDDWYRDRIRGPEYARDIVMRNLHSGAVLLLHAVSKDNAQALDSIIKGAAQLGYTIGDPQELLPPEKEEVGN
jgi:peptidoglycan-N-acetylmuramic acid deacetylase